MENLTSENFEEQTKDKYAIVDFYADWCGPCKQLGPAIEAMSNDYDNISFFKVNVEDSPELAAKFGVRGIPHVILLGPDQKVVDTVVGNDINKILKMANSVG